MGVIWFYIRKSFTLFRQEVLVLPSRVAVLVFVLAMLLIPVFIDDPYLLRILILTSVFAIFAASWDLLSGFTGQVNFGHALFFGVAAYTSGLINVHYKIPHILSIPLGAIAGVSNRADRWHPLFKITGNLSRPDHFVVSYHPHGHNLCHSGCDRRRIRGIRP